MTYSFLYTYTIDTKPPRGWENIEIPDWGYIAASLVSIKAVHIKISYLLINCNKMNTYYVVINVME